MAKTHRKKGVEIELPEPVIYVPPEGRRSAECQAMFDFCSLCGGTGDIVTPTGEWRGICPYHPEFAEKGASS